MWTDNSKGFASNLVYKKQILGENDVERRKQQGIRHNTLNCVSVDYRCDC